MIEKIIGILARRGFARSISFDRSVPPSLPACPRNIPRLLYLHVPFCVRLCPYCSFHRVPFQEELGRAYYQALRKEIWLYKERGFDFQGVYVGGGTPTVLVEELEETLGLARQLFQLREISVETNPNHLNDGAIAALQKMGVNRLSIGIQSFQESLLKKMERYEKYGSGETIAQRLREIEGAFDTINADMIFNFPSQTREMLAADLQTLLETRVNQITYYPLMLSAFTQTGLETALGQVSYNKEKEFYGQIASTLLPDYRQSSAWCFSRAGGGTIIDEYIVDYDEYAGLGSGAIGYLGGACYANTFDIPRYIEELGKGKLPLFARRDFRPLELARYDWLMKLFGMKASLSGLVSRQNQAIIPFFLLDMAFFFLVGALGYRQGELYLTNRGAYLWVVMMREFFTAVNNFRDFCRKELE